MIKTIHDGRNGFTLIEVLIVLGVLSIIIILSIPINYRVIHQQQEKNFIKMFELDLLYIQSLATTTREQVQIIVDQGEYKIYKGPKNSPILIRKVPESIRINMLLRHNISFDENGRIRYPNRGKIEIITKDSKYYVIFPLGKGRASIVKQ